jgi:hypothetical protein
LHGQTADAVSASVPITQIPDVGQSWFAWDPDTAIHDERLDRAVSEFEPVPCAAGWAAARWLKEDSLASHGLTVTYLAVVDMRVEGFYALCAAEVEISSRQRAGLRLQHPRQGVALAVWLARRTGGRLSGLALIAHALARAEAVAELQGLCGLALDPYDEETAVVWRSAPYRFLPSRTTCANGLARLWKPLPSRLARLAAKPPKG